MTLSKCVVRLFLIGFLGFQCVGCQGSGSFLNTMKMSSLNWWSEDVRAQNSKDGDDGFDSSGKTGMIGDHTTVSGLNLMLLEGVGLVTNLDGTGGDPADSRYKKALLNDMRQRGIKNPVQILRSPNTALVVVRAYLPPLVRKGDSFDVEIRLPESSRATSLSGGWLLQSRLSERAIVAGKGVMKGHVFAVAAGPILVSTNTADREENAGRLQRGMILGGGISYKERDLSLYLRNDFKSYRNSKRISQKIAARFFQYTQSGLREPLAVAKTNQLVMLKIQNRYRENFPRYLSVIRNIPFRETKSAERVRMGRLKGELLRPETSERAAIQLEAIGKGSVMILKGALKSPLLEVRFHAAMALAYLGDSAGVEVLAEAARKEPAFRVFAFAAMSVIENSDVHSLLRELIDDKVAETRYGAVRTLTTLNKNDPLIRGVRLGGQFQLRELATNGPPLVHVTRHRQSEIVLFGSDQRFSTPLFLSAGRGILITAKPGSREITVSRFNKNLKKVVSTRVGDVIRTAVAFGASYPEVVALLMQADRQNHLPGDLEIDALPRAGRTYYRGKKNEWDNKSAVKRDVRIGRSTMAPGLFSTGSKKRGADDFKKAHIKKEQNDKKTRNDLESRNESKSGHASLADVPVDGVDEKQTLRTERKKPAEKPMKPKPMAKKKPWYNPTGWFAKK